MKKDFQKELDSKLFDNDSLLNKFKNVALKNDFAIKGGEPLPTDAHGIGQDCIDDTSCGDGTTGSDVYLGSCC